MRQFTKFLFLILVLGSVGCVRSSTQTWEDLKTAGRYMHRGVDAVFGKDYESRLLTSDEEFIGPYDGDFIPLRDADLHNSMSAMDSSIPQPKAIPGQKGVPSLNEFQPAPDTLSMIFHSLHFETDQHVLKNKNDIEALSQIAMYLTKNPSILLMVEGHCDERASAGYNLALGLRRANYVRSFLVKKGVDLNRIYTVSRGKEQPLIAGHTPEEWKINRRSEFKIYQK
jgi:outer membrane protein OmpA-like peptidoglycan-associated protein